MRFFLLTVVALCSACHSGSSGDPGEPDADRDGVVASSDCNDNDATMWRATSLFADTDHDRSGAGQPVASCVGNSTPAGFSTTSTDCAPSDPAVHTLMLYAGRDADGDTVPVAAAGSVCGNGATLPARYFANAGNAPSDCDDQNASFWQLASFHEDLDRDGIGHGGLVSVCSGNGPPPGFSETSTDCAPSDPALHTPMSYAARDSDGDTVLVPAAGSVCGNGATLPARYFGSAGSAPADCNDQNALFWQLASFREDFDRDGVGHGPLVSVCSGSGAPPGFAMSSTDCSPLDTTKWRMMASYSDVDGDGVGSGPMVPLCVGTGSAPFGSSFLGFDPLDTVTDPDSALVSDFDLNIPSLIVETDDSGFDLP
jgi:hypothetical protein